QGLNPARRLAGTGRVASRIAGAGLYPRIAGDGIDHDPLAANDILALADRHMAGERNGLALQVVNAEIASGVLILGEDGDAALCLDAADILRALRHAGRRF